MQILSTSNDIQTCYSKAQRIAAITGESVTDIMEMASEVAFNQQATMVAVLEKLLKQILV